MQIYRDKMCKKCFFFILKYLFFTLKDGLKSKAADRKRFQMSSGTNGASQETLCTWLRMAYHAQVS